MGHVSASSAASPRRAFTLTEILVVLSIIGILAAISFALFSRQRESAYRTQCQHNLSQMYKAMQMYVQDHDSRYPPYPTWSSALEPYIKSAATFVCPSVSEHDSYHPDVDYELYAGRVGPPLVRPQGEQGLTGVHEAALPATSSWILIADSEKSQSLSMSPVNYPRECALSLTGRDNFFRAFGTFHSGGGNYLFTDGHVKWFAPQSAMQTDCAAGPFLR